jgi:heat shock protein HtpX
MVLMMTGAKPADKKTYFDLYTVVENMAMADGLPMPKVYVINDPAPNAFATGRDPKHAVVCATTGILERLYRSELEAVMAHELSHVKNYDILVMGVVSVLVGTIAFVADWMMRSFMWGGFGGRDEDSRKGNQLTLFLFVILLIISPIVATLIQLAVSRRREYLADASGALLNRNPDALADALVKISSDPHVLRTATNATAHLFIANPFQKLKKDGQPGFTNWIAGLFSTHPPIQERIRILREM